MTRGQTGFLALFFLGLLLIVLGTQGNLGQLIAILFCPAYVSITQE